MQVACCIEKLPVRVTAVGWILLVKLCLALEASNLGPSASSLRSEGAYEDRRPVPNPVFLLEEFGIERGALSV